MKDEIKLSIHYIKPYRFLILFNFLLLIIISFAQGFGTGMLVPIIQSISNQANQDVFTKFISKGFNLLEIPYTFNTITIAFACIILFKYLIEGVQLHYNRVLTSTISYDLQRKCYDSLMSFPLSFYYKRKIGDIVATQYTSAINCGGMIDNLLLLLKSSLLALGYFIVGCIISIKMTLFLCFLGCASLVFIIPRYQIGFLKGEKLKDIIDSIHSYLYDTLSGVKTIMAFNNKDMHRREFNERIIFLKKLAVSIMDNKILSNMAIEPFMFILIIISLLIAVNLWHISIASLIILLFIFVQIVPQLKNCNRAILMIKELMPHFTKIHELINHKSKSYFHKRTLKVSTFNQEIRLENVSFRYDGSRDYTLKGISMVVKKGQTVALVGSTGAGKTTLADLILGYHNISDGHIMLDGIDIMKLDITYWRQIIGSVEQDTYMFNDSVYNNIAYGKQDSNRAEVVNAAKLAHAHEFIEDLPNGYETVVGTRGITLSGGQRQRLALARVFLKDPEILILDEATSSLDSKSEQLIQMAINSIKTKKTLIIIAHRLSTIIDADCIFLIEQGRLLEVGDHNSLLKKKGRYCDFYDLQFRNHTTDVNN